jgi:hypothetical protein
MASIQILTFFLILKVYDRREKNYGRRNRKDKKSSKSKNLRCEKNLSKFKGKENKVRIL